MKTFLTHLSFGPEQCWECENEIFTENRRLDFECSELMEKIVSKKILSKLVLFDLDADRKTISGPLPSFMVFAVNTSS